jgi:CubicO group peptidase (beta-lactamase class C family)
MMCRVVRSLSSAIVVIGALVPSALAVDMPLPRSTPESQGVHSAAIGELVARLDKIDAIHSVMVVRHGHVIGQTWWSPQRPDEPHVLNSVSKSFNATAVGLAIHSGRLSLDDPVLKFFPDDAPPDPSDNLRAMTVRDLLTMTSGQAEEVKIAGDHATVKSFLAQPVPFKPGTHFLYNTLSSYVLSAIVTKVTGQTSLAYLKPRLFEPLGIRDPRWLSSPEGNSLGGFGLYLRTEDVAKFGQLYLQKGMWNGTQLVPAAWVEQATHRQVSNELEDHRKIGIDWRQGYGFQFWHCTHNAFRADGAGGQFCVVMPDQDAVVVITASTGNMQGELNAIWDGLLPGFGDHPLPEDAAAQERLQRAIADLKVRPAKP